MYLTVAEQIFMLEEKIKKRRTHFLLKDVYDFEIFKLYSKDLNFCWTSLSWKSKKWKYIYKQYLNRFNSNSKKCLISTNVEKRVTLIPKFLITYVKPKSRHDSTKYIGGTILVFSDKSMANVTDAIALR